MTEILTESFCERCGTRYTFESVAPRQRRLGGIRVLGRGLRNFVMSDDSSLDEAMAAARSDAERDATTQQLDAFHRTFNFCMSCRQYTCRDCWNATDARCLSCAPLPGVRPHAAHPPPEGAGPLLELDAARRRRIGVPVDPAVSRDEPEMIGVAEATAHAAPPVFEPDVPEPPFALDAAARMPAEADFGFASDAEPIFEAATPGPWIEAVPGPAFEPDADVAAAAQESEAGLPAGPGEPVPSPGTTVPGFEPGTSLDDAIAAYEASIAEEPMAEGVGSSGPGIDLIEQPTWASRSAVQAEPVAVSEGVGAPASAEAVGVPTPETATTPEPVAEFEAGRELAPVVAEPVAAPQPPTPEPESEPVAAGETAAPAPEPPTAPAAPEPTAAAPAPQPPTAPSATPQWPTGPRWPTGIPARSPVSPPAQELPPLTAVVARQATEAMWAASSLDVVQPIAAAQAPSGGVQPCVNCGISLSATARFCRRCGTSQLT